MQICQSTNSPKYHPLLGFPSPSKKEIKKIHYYILKIATSAGN